MKMSCVFDSALLSDHTGALLLSALYFLIANLAASHAGAVDALHPQLRHREALKPDLRVVRLDADANIFAIFTFAQLCRAVLIFKTWRRAHLV